MITDSLLIRYIAGQVNSTEKTEVLYWLCQDPDNENRLQSLRTIYEEDYQLIGETDMLKDWDKILAGMNNSALIESPGRSISLVKVLRAAAAIFILLLGTALIMKLSSDNYTIRGTSDTPVANILPDGSEVFLTKGSRVRYSKEFNKDLREISITGDAFFTVTSDPNRPFIVQTGEAKIKVTGTSFRVSAPYKKDEVEVVVRSGKVLFYNSETYSENSFKVGLGPGDKGIYSSRLNQLNKTHDSQYKQLSWN